MRPIVSAIRLARSWTNEEQRKVAKFVLVGGGKTICGYVLYLTLLWIGLHYNVALLGDYVVGVAVGYVLSRTWTFSNQGQPKAAVLKYLVAFVLVFLLNWAALNLVVGAGMDPASGQIPCLVLATVASYLLQRYWVFRGHDDSAGASNTEEASL